MNQFPVWAGYKETKMIRRLWTEKILQRGGNTFVPTRIKLDDHYTDLKYQLKKYKELKAATAQITFTCFDEGKKCYKRVAEDSNARCCCGGCRSSLGFFDDDIIFEKDFETYNKLFINEFEGKKASGFWRKGTGCALPRELRSKTCVSYNCESNGVRDMIGAIESRISTLQQKIRVQLSTVLSRQIIRPRIKKKYSEPKADSESPKAEDKPLGTPKEYWSVHGTY